jgi:hypothetical protein
MCTELLPSYDRTRRSVGGCKVVTHTYGGGGGGSFVDVPFHCHGTIRKIVIHSGTVIDSIQLFFDRGNGQYHVSARHGGGGGGRHEITLFSSERIIGIFGKTGHLVDQLGFVTNYGRIFGPYGACGGSPFTVNSCELRGIYGKSGALLDSIGFFCSGGH